MAFVGESTASTPGRRRFWRSPGSKYNWLFLLLSLLLAGGVFLLYYYALQTQQFPDPASDPFREFGIAAFVMILLVMAYTLRRRFVRRLPGKVQNWLWLHVWFGVASLLIVFMHENFQNITRSFAFDSERFTEAAFGTSALYALVFLVLSGLFGRLLDIWQARVISIEASHNKVGIAPAVEERLQELTLTLERLSAGKSAQFKKASTQLLRARNARVKPPSSLSQRDASDFQQVTTVARDYARLKRSYRRQIHARSVMRAWRYIHIPLACLSLVVITYHAVFELWSMWTQ